MYLEEDSSKFTHKGYTYSVNDIIVATKDTEVEVIPLTCFYWMIPLVKVNEDRLGRADVSVPVIYTIDEDFSSKMISAMPEPAVIISAAGMVEGGRIQEHIRHNIGDAFSTILIAGYCAEGTLGAELLKGRPTVSINKRERQVYAKVQRTDAFSAHPDQNGLMRYLEASDYKNMKKYF